MRLLNFTAPTPSADLALEEAIHLSVEAGASPATWRLWIAREPAIVLGTGQEHQREANVPEARKRGVHLLRRHSGGGAVVIGPGAINFSAFYPYNELEGSGTIKGAMLAALLPVVEVLRRWNLKPHDAGLSDIALLCQDGLLRKVAGNSQARKKNSVVVHGTLLADPDWERMAAVLPFPSSVPEYRAGRGHREFLTSLKEQGAPCDLDSFRDSLLTVLPGAIECADAATAVEQQRAAELLEEKYTREDWNFRR